MKEHKSLPTDTVEVNLADLNRKQRRKLASVMTKRHKAEKKKKKSKK